MNLALQERAEAVDVVNLAVTLWAFALGSAVGVMDSWDRISVAQSAVVRPD